MSVVRISGAEAQVMEALWAHSPSSAEEVVSRIAEPQGWTEATVKSLLNRLLKKGAVAAEKDGRRFLYRPLVSRPDYVQAESQGLLDRLFDGRLAPMVSHFSQNQALSPDDIADLRRLLKELER